MYSNKFFNIYFHEWMYFKIFASKGDTFLEGHGFNILIQKSFSEKWEQIYQVSLKSETIEGNPAVKKFP